MDDHQLARLLPDCVAEHWGRTPTAVETLGGGMNSATALVRFDQDRFVAKWVAQAGGPAMRVGADIARRLAEHGLSSGPPLPTSTGDLVVPVADGFLALLEFVAGTPLTDAAEEQVIIATTLADAHRALGTELKQDTFFPWLGDNPALAEVADWVLPSINFVQDEYRTLPPVTWGTLHTDPTTEAFLHDERSGRTGLIDWSGACPGPILYDIASAVMYLGGLQPAKPFLDTYAAAGVLPTAELGDHLAAFRRFRAIVQADYFANRILDNDLTGISGQAENRQGLDDARRMLEELGGLRS